MLSTSAFVGQRVVAAKTAAKVRPPISPEENLTFPMVGKSASNGARRPVGPRAQSRHLRASPPRGSIARGITPRTVRGSSPQPPNRGPVARSAPPADRASRLNRQPPIDRARIGNPTIPLADDPPSPRNTFPSRQPRKVACKVVSAHAEPRQIALAGVAAASLVLDAASAFAAPSAALDASALYKKVEPERASKSRFDGTEVAKLKANGGKTAPAPKAGSSSASKAAPASKTTSSSSKKKSSKKTDSQASSGGALAAVVALGGLFAANATRGGDSSSSSSSSSGSSGGKSDAAANAAEAQKWIDSWKGSSPAPASGADTPEGRAAEAQAWIDAWKAKQ